MPSGHTPDAVRARAGCRKSTHRASSKHTPDAVRTRAGCRQGIHRMPSGHTPGVLLEHSGHTPTILRQSYGQRLPTLFLPTQGPAPARQGSPTATASPVSAHNTLRPSCATSGEHNVYRTPPVQPTEPNVRRALRPPAPPLPSTKSAGCFIRRAPPLAPSDATTRDVHTSPLLSMNRSGGCDILPAPPLKSPRPLGAASTAHRLYRAHVRRMPYPPRTASTEHQVCRVLYPRRTASAELHVRRVLHPLRTASGAFRCHHARRSHVATFVDQPVRRASYLSPTCSATLHACPTRILLRPASPPRHAP